MLLIVLRRLTTAASPAMGCRCIGVSFYEVASHFLLLLLFLLLVL
jgi:hypothetical protein